MSHPQTNGVHNFGNACLVICTEQGRTARSNDIVPDLVFQVGMLRIPDNYGGVVWQDNILTLVIRMYKRFYVLSGTIRGGIHMGAKTDDGYLFIGIRRYRRIDISIFIQMCITNAELL